MAWAKAMHGRLGAESGAANVPPDLVQLVVNMVQAELPDRDVASDTLGELAAQPLSTSRLKPRRPGVAAPKGDIVILRCH